MRLVASAPSASALLAVIAIKTSEVIGQQWITVDAGRVHDAGAPSTTASGQQACPPSPSCSRRAHQLRGQPAMAALSARTYDTIVVGLGAHGSAALYHLARRGAQVGGRRPARPAAAGAVAGSVRLEPLPLPLQLPMAPPGAGLGGAAAGGPLHGLLPRPLAHHPPGGGGAVGGGEQGGWSANGAPPACSPVLRGPLTVTPLPPGLL